MYCELVKKTLIQIKPTNKLEEIKQTKDEHSEQNQAKNKVLGTKELL